MASRADNIASNMSFANFSKATELKSRIWFTVGALIVFRFMSFVPLPGVNPMILEELYKKTQGGILDVFNAFSGGSLQRMSLIALGVMPYITASIVVQLAASLHPALMAIKKEGEAGRKKLNQYTRYGAVFLTAIQGWFLAVGLEAFSASSGLQAVVDPGYIFRIGAVISLIGGTMFLLWLGEQITSRGIGNGVSLIIMAGIVAQMPTFFGNLFEQGRTGALSPFLIASVMAMLVAGLRLRLILTAGFALADQIRSAAVRFIVLISSLCRPDLTAVIASTSAHTWNRNWRTPSCTGTSLSILRNSIVYWMASVSRCSTCCASDTPFLVASFWSRKYCSRNFSNSVNTVWNTRRPVSG